PLALDQCGFLFAEPVVKLEFLLCLRCLAVLFVGESEAVVSLGKLLVRANRFLQSADRLFRFALLRSDYAKLQPGFAERGIDLYSPHEQLPGAFEIRSVL